MTGKRNIRLSKCSVGSEEKEAVLRVLENEYLGMGKEVQAFEEELKIYLQTEMEVICVNTGTAALHLAIQCLDIGPGDEVLVPSITYVASYQAISATGATPISCDVLEDSCFIDLIDAEKRLTKKTRALMPVHYASDSSKMDEVYLFAKKHNLRVVEDAAHSMGSLRNGKLVGGIGDVLCFSFDGIKNITSGEGGLVVTGDLKLAQRIKDARLLGVEKDTEKRFLGIRSWQFDVHHQGFRYHMSDLMAAIGRAQLKKISAFSKRRREIAKMYNDAFLGHAKICPLKLNYNEIVPHIYVVKCSGIDRNDLQDSLKDRGVMCGIHYQPNHLLSFFRSSYTLPVAESLGQNLLTLPIHPDLSNEDIEYVIQTMLELVG
jgi:dTDP-4-amino-4,6-dideoxygalactose transaminase